VVESEASPVTDEAELHRVAGAFEVKYGSLFTAPQGTWFGLGDAIGTGGAIPVPVAPDHRNDARRRQDDEPFALRWAAASTSGLRSPS
jgi:hypothetical protein